MRPGLTRWRPWITAALLAALAVAGVLASPGARWRARVGLRKMAGGLPEVSWRELAAMTRPGGIIYLEPLARGRSPYAVIRNPYRTAADLVAGRNTFRTACSGCHGHSGEGGTGPGLRNLAARTGSSDWALFRTITRGIPGTPMVPRRLEPRTVWQVVGYVQSLRPGPAAAETMPASALPRLEPVSSDQPAVDGAANAWPTYSGNYLGWRYSGLDEIDRSNVEQLRLLWTYQTNGQAPFEATPLVLGGWFYFTEPNTNRVVALDAETGREIWSYVPTLPTDLRLCCGPVNRGLAALNDLLYLGTLDARLIALDARTGRMVWEQRVARYEDGYSITAAPLAVDGKVFVGIAGGEFGIRGFLDCYDASTGRRLWRFHTIPAPGERGSETWSGHAWKTGGGATWVTGSYDPALRLVYWGVGNPGPDYSGTTRAGDNLYTSGVIALHADSGTLAWHFQFTPHDNHDWDANHTPLLVTAPIKGGPARRLVVMATKNGFYYALDRVTGEFLRGVPFAWQTWADSLDWRGRPSVRAGMDPTPGGTLVAPASSGATNWMPPSFSPRTGYVYIPSRDEAELFFSDHTDYEPGALYLGGSVARPTGGGAVTAVRALDAASGSLQWEYRFSDELGPGAGFSFGGILTTASNLVFAGAGREFVALDAASGARLWRITTGNIKAAPIAWAINGRQRISIAAGQSMFTFGVR